MMTVQSTLNIKGKLLQIKRPLIMGVINITPDSFYAGSRQGLDQVLDTAKKMIADGASFLDLGGHSTRPGAEKVSVQEEIDRVLPAIDALIKEIPDAILSIDTYRSIVASAAIDHGAAIINDISGGQLDNAMFEMVAKKNVPYILGHMKGNFDNMMSETDYQNVIIDITDYFVVKTNQLLDLGVKDIIIDPGFGFSKTLDQNYELLKSLGYFSNLGMPVMAGISRKSMIYKYLDLSPEEALNGTTVLNTIALTNGASILRVHDIKEANEVVKLYEKTIA